MQPQGEATLTADEKLNIALLANSCPVSVGNCVYKARTLNTLLQPGAQYQDELLCSAAMPQNKNGLNLFEEEEKILANGIPSGDVLQGDHEMIIYPNPNKTYGKLSVKYKLLSTNPATLTINTMAGQTLRNIAVNLDLQSTILDLENIAQGIYQVSLQQEGSPTLTRKLVIGD